jgi:hypothetical protein
VTGDLKKWRWLSAGYRRFIGMIGAKKFQVSEKCQEEISGKLSHSSVQCFSEEAQIEKIVPI